MRKFIQWAIGDWQDCVIAAATVAATVVYCVYVSAP
jgi:hypothetical protein